MVLHIKKIFPVFACLLMISGLSLEIQGQMLDSTLQKISRQYLPEKAFIHFDKSSYLPGETAWFKIYLMEGLIPAEESKNVYVDWVSETGEVLSHQASPIVDGISIGQFDIPETYKSQMVHVRAYTKWMLNFDSSVIYKKEIRIHQKQSATRQAMPEIQTVLDFFPEGGDLVAGVPNRVAFKATDQ